MRRRYTNIETTDLDLASTFTNMGGQNTSVLTALFETPANVGGRYSQKITGYFIPTMNGGGLSMSKE